MKTDKYIGKKFVDHDDCEMEVMCKVDSIIPTYKVSPTRLTKFEQLMRDESSYHYWETTLLMIFKEPGIK